MEKQTIDFSVDFDQQGICYRVYPQSLFDEKISENIHSEMARQPLLVGGILRQMASFIRDSSRRISCKRNYSRGRIVQWQNLC